MKITVVLGIVLFILSFTLSYIIIYASSKWVIKSERLNSLRVILAIITGALITSFYLFVSPVRNSYTTTIAKNEGDYRVTIIGERLTPVDNLLSYLKRETYWDTLRLDIPRPEGIIKGDEIPTPTGYYRLSGTLTIQNDKMTLDLYYDHPISKTKSPMPWNGTYKIGQR